MAATDERLTKSRAALAALERSLARLESAVGARKDEQALIDDLAAARAEYDRMAGTVRAVEERLGSVRDRLRAVLGA